MGIQRRDAVRQRALEQAGSVLMGAEPARAGVFRRTLDLLMHDVLNHASQEAAWTYSTLNSNGSPLEFTYSTLNDEVRYTVEVGGPDLSPVHRLAKVQTLLLELGAEESAFAELIVELQSLQAGAALRWGAWLGVRHRSDSTEYKVYAEVPHEGSVKAEQLVDEYLGGPPPGPAGRAPHLVAVGRSPDSERCEFYYYLPGRGLSRDQLHVIMAHVGLADRLDDLWELAQEVRISRGSDSLPEVEFGLSFSALPGKTAVVCSVFAFAGDYVGGDALVRRQALQTAQQRGWSLGSYAAMTAPVARRALRCEHHNVLAFIAGPAPVLGLHVSLSPPFLEDDR
jgi:hypothetical protein